MVQFSAIKVNGRTTGAKTPLSEGEFQPVQADRLMPMYSELHRKHVFHSTSAVLESDRQIQKFVGSTPKFDRQIPKFVG